MDECIDDAWGIIANVSGGDWDEQTGEWVKDAESWRDKYIWNNKPKMKLTKRDLIFYTVGAAVVTGIAVAVMYRYFG